MVGEGKGESDLFAAGRPGHEFGTEVGGKAEDRPRLSRSHIQQFQPVEIVFTRLAEVTRVHTQATDPGLAFRKFGNGYLTAGPISHHGLRIVSVEDDGRQRAGQCEFFNLLGGMAETVRHGGQAAGQQKGRRQNKDFSGHCSKNYCLQM